MQGRDIYKIRFPLSRINFPHTNRTFAGNIYGVQLLKHVNRYMNMMAYDLVGIYGNDNESHVLQIPQKILFLQIPQ